MNVSSFLTPIFAVYMHAFHTQSCGWWCRPILEVHMHTFHAQSCGLYAHILHSVLQSISIHFTLNLVVSTDVFHIQQVTPIPAVHMEANEHQMPKINVSFNKCEHEKKKKKKGWRKINRSTAKWGWSKSFLEVNTLFNAPAGGVNLLLDQLTRRKHTQKYNFPSTILTYLQNSFTQGNHFFKKRETEHWRISKWHCDWETKTCKTLLHNAYIMKQLRRWGDLKRDIKKLALTFENMDEGSTSFSTDRGIWCSQNPVRQGNEVFPAQQFRFPIINASLLFTLLSVCL